MAAGLMNSEKKIIMGTYKVFKKVDNNLVWLGMITEDGLTLTINAEEKEVRNGQVKALFDKYKYFISATLETNIKQFDEDLLPTAIPGMEIIVDPANGNRFTVVGKAVSLREEASTFVLKPYGEGEDDESQWITLFQAANDAEFSITFKADEESSIPLKLLAFPDEENGNRILQIGKVVI